MSRTPSLSSRFFPSPPEPRTGRRTSALLRRSPPAHTSTIAIRSNPASDGSCLPIIYQVHRERDGTSFATRKVEANQKGIVIFTLIASLQCVSMAGDHFLEGILNEDSTPIWSQETSQFVSQPEDQASLIKEDSSSLRFSKRSKKFSKNEDNMLVSAYLAISLDPVQGNDQSGRTYWNRMHHFFHTHKEFRSDRGEKSLSNRLAVIMKDTSLFKGYYDKIQLRNQSGTSDSDKIVQSLAMYTSEEKRSPFFLHCWNTLKHQ